MRGELDRLNDKRPSKNSQLKVSPKKGADKPSAIIEENSGQKKYDFESLKEKHFGQSGSKASKSPGRESHDGRLSPIPERHGQESSSRIIHMPRRGYSEYDR